jgi:lipopolysaccharide/colanic/teichoic acid biosynthesis glycosyltransferase
MTSLSVDVVGFHTSDAEAFARRPRAARWAKVGIDRVGGALLLVILLPLLVFIAVMIWCDDRGPVLYRQVRVGYQGKLLRIWKFRTMRVDADSLLVDLLSSNDGDGCLLFKMRRDPRVTRVGRVIRRWSIDELPQLLNVVVGQMSLVGPRPLPGNDLAAYTLTERQRFLVRPGITGLWQVSGRSELDWTTTMATDLRYVAQWTLRMDAAILLRTIPAVVKGVGAY